MLIAHIVCPHEIIDVHGSDGSSLHSHVANNEANAENSIQNQNDSHKSDAASTIAQSNPFIKSKFDTSDNSFKFNFSIGCD